MRLNFSFGQVALWPLWPLWPIQFRKYGRGIAPQVDEISWLRTYGNPWHSNLYFQYKRTLLTSMSVLTQLSLLFPVQFLKYLYESIYKLIYCQVAPTWTIIVFYYLLSIIIKLKRRFLSFPRGFPRETCGAIFHGRKIAYVPEIREKRRQVRLYCKMNYIVN
jgi:hypothetical protein